MSTQKPDPTLADKIAQWQRTITLLRDSERQFWDRLLDAMLRDLGQR